MICSPDADMRMKPAQLSHRQFSGPGGTSSETEIPKFEDARGEVSEPSGISGATAAAVQLDQVFVLLVL